MIRIDNLGVRFGSAVAVQDVSLAVESGESFGLVGESGSGKSTVLRTVMGLNRQWTGDISIAGIDLRRGRRKDLVRVAQMVFQDPYASLHPRQTVDQAIAGANARSTVCD
jgi:peptide/nickel transport system ATP-binding protein